MSKVTFLYSELEAPQLSFDLNEVGWSAVSFLNQFFNEGVKETKRKLTLDEVDTRSKDHHIYMVMEIDDPKYKGVSLGKELSQLNTCEGFKASIDVKADSFNFKPGAQVRVVGKKIQFRVSNAA